MLQPNLTNTMSIALITAGHQKHYYNLKLLTQAASRDMSHVSNMSWGHSTQLHLAETKRTFMTRTPEATKKVHV